MPYTAPIVGYCTPRGHVRCVRCVDDLDRTEGTALIGDTCGTAEDPCDTCGRRLYTEPMRCDGYVHVPYNGAPVPEITPSNPYWPTEEVA